ncbi:hypothetical protein RD792_015808 [Penstemon davidsonii]|uniref:Uncharacterized protein n=1 Tax=Penstemon davidsonii TaxID=160366 RepID=A0ABR0CKA7_9LAMI|nr:hypothetical protein RD792_015808 [Penstemon davidsonii]
MTNNTAGEGSATDGVCIESFVDSGSVESHRYYIARRTVIEMLGDRGYTVANAEEELSRSLDGFRAAFGDKPDPDRLRLLAHRDSNPSRKILVIFCGAYEIRKKDMVSILSQIMNKETLDKVTLILQGNINSHAKKVMNECSVKVETFPITDLLVNITKHVRMPKHEILTVEEKQMLLNKFNIEDKQLPKMLEGDAIARYYGLQKGQVVKISYDGAITESLVTYRCVV